MAAKKTTETVDTGFTLAELHHYFGVTLRELNKEVTYQMCRDHFELCRHMELQDKVKAHEMNAKLRPFLISGAIDDKFNEKEQNEFYALYRQSLLFDSRYDFDAYMLFIESNRPPEQQFYAPRRSVLKVIVDDLNDLDRGNLDYLSVSLPVRSGKSTLGCFFITWLMGKYPDQSNLMSGHNDKLTDSFYKEVLSIIEDTQKYMWNVVFPEHKITNTSAKDESVDISSPKAKRRYPTLTCRSIGGALTGAVEAAKCLYCDDLIEDLEESLSPDRLQAKYDAYLNQLKDRKKEGCFELMIGTRWTPFDVQGRIEEQYKDNPRYRFRVIPALNDKDESNFDYPFGVGFSTQYYHDMRRNIDDATWHAKFLGRPYVREGLLFPQDELRYYNGVLPPDDPDRIVATVDVAWGGGDSLAMPIGYMYGDDIYIHDIVFNRGDKSVTQPIVVGKIAEHRPHQIVGEANAGGEAYMEAVEKGAREYGIRTNISSRKTPSTATKVSRVIEFSSEIKNHFIFRDAENSSNDYRRFMREVTTFVVSGKNPHDDAPDSLAMMASLLFHENHPVEVFRRPF